MCIFEELLFSVDIVNYFVFRWYVIFISVIFCVVGVKDDVGYIFDLLVSIIFKIFFVFDNWYFYYLVEIVNRFYIGFCVSFVFFVFCGFMLICLVFL